MSFPEASIIELPRFRIQFRTMRMWRGILVLLTIGLVTSVQAAPSEDRIAQAQALQQNGALDEALKIYQSLLAGSGPPSAQMAQALAGVSQIALSQGDYSKAIQFAQDAAAMYRSLGDASGEARALNDKGIAEIEHGDYPAAQNDLGTALVLSRKAGDAETEVKTLNNQGSVYFFQGKYQEAQRDYQTAAQLVEHNSAQAWSSYWKQITDFNQATLYQRLGRYEKALQIYRSVRDASGTQLSASDRAHLFTNLGALYRRLGDPVKTLESYQSALELYARQRDADGEIGTLKNIGIVNAVDLGNLNKAQQVFEQALALAKKSMNRREEMQAHLYLGETWLRRREWKPAQSDFQDALAAAKALGTTEEQWKALYGLGRIEEGTGTPQAAESNYRQAIAIIESSRAQLQLSALRAEFLADKRDAYDALIALLFQRGDVEEAFSVLERSRARTFQDRLNDRPASATAPTLKETQQHLDDATMLLEFWTSKDRLGLIWCTRADQGMAQKKLSPSELDSVRALLKDFPNNLNDDWLRQVSVLRALLPDDISFLKENVKHLLIVPDGWFSFVPFDLVPLDQNSLLVERFDISYLPSAALLLRTQREQKLLPPWTRQLVAFGDPAVQRESAAPDALLDGGNAAMLPHSAEEIHSIYSLASGKAELLLGANDLKSAFLGGKANSALLLHVSTHAVANADNPEDSRLLFSSADSNQPADYAYLRELYELRLDDVDLATLSACDTERGKMIRGEGVQAFSRALLSAGARASLTTLGRVDDEATAEFMKQFYYFALRKHQAKAEALRSAKLKFMHSGTRLANPAYWAAFVLNGDGLTPLPRVISWAEVAAYTAAALALLLLIFFLRSRRGIHR